MQVKKINDFSYSLLGHKGVGWVYLEEYLGGESVNVINPKDKMTMTQKRFNGDLRIVSRARQSTDKANKTTDNLLGDYRLLKRLISEGHTSPMEACVFTFNIKAPIFVIRQWQRHRTQSYNEVSARYTQLQCDFYVPLPNHITNQSKYNKQSKDKVVNKNANLIADKLVKHSENCYKEYESLLNLGCPRELSRGVLPVNFYSAMSTTVNLNNLFKFLFERLQESAQEEIQLYASCLLKIVYVLFPVTTLHFVENFYNKFKICLVCKYLG